MSQRQVSISEQAIAARERTRSDGPAGGMHAGAVHYLDSLNDAQRQAVEALDGPVLVLAGAGTGKTRVLTTRLAHILRSDLARPHEVLAVTFTNKAAREMKERIGQLVGPVVEGMRWLGTFHSISALILRRHAELVDLKPDFTIIDTDDQIRLLKQLIVAAGIDEKRWNARMLAAIIDRWKNKALPPNKVPSDDAQAFADGKALDLYDQYQKRLKVINAADFGDLLLECIRLFQEHTDVLMEYQSKFRYLLVDEYQDTNVAQYLWLRLLAQGHHNVCCVGDDDQSIYGWRGAEVENILKFERDFPGAQVIRLEQNYRSTPHILGAATGLISANESRLGKTLWTDLDQGEKVAVQGVWDGDEEARVVCDDIEAQQRDGRSLDDIAILVRASSQMRAFEDRFISLGLNYRVVGGPRFYERKENRDALAYFRLVAQQDDDLAFERIINVPKRGLGNAAVQALHNIARTQGCSLLRAARMVIETDELPRARKALTNFIRCIDRWSAQMTTLPHTELAEIILEESGYTDMLQNDKSADAPGRLENLKELVNSMDEFENMAGFLEHVSLVMDNTQSDDGEKVSLMTLHSAKGLEFPVVFLPGWEEGLFPNQRSLDEGGVKALEEERRLAYVGITRAREIAKISFAANRRLYNQWSSAIPSRFVDELPREHVDVVSAKGVYGNASHSSFGPDGFDDENAMFDVGYDRYAGSYNSPGWQRAQRPGRRQPPLIEQKAERVMRDDAAAFSIGERVFHIKFGYGRITAKDGNKLTVEFEKAGQKKVMASFVEKP